jgi:hypothetical protein
MFTIPDLHAVRDDVPEALEAALRRACAYDPGDRFPNGTAMREAIEAAGFATGERPIPSPTLLGRIKRLFE